jgi:hypothetical protein
MRSYKSLARVGGVLYIIATVAIIASFPFIGAFESADFMTELAANETQVVLGMLVQLAWVFAVMFIPVVFFPVLKLYSEAGALGFFSLRFTEAVMSLIYVAIHFTLLGLSITFVESGAADSSAYGSSGSLLLEARDWAFALGAGLAFNLSALLLNYVLYRSRLVPRWLSIWGLIGAALWTIAWFPQAFGAELGVLELVFLPIAVQEMVFGVYLIVRGFDSNAIADLGATGQPSMTA